MKKNATQNTLYRYIDLYEKHLARNKSQHTIVNYISDLNQFVNYLEENQLDFNLDTFDKDAFLDYLDHLKAKYVPATTHRKAISLSGFLSFLNRTGKLKATPFIDGKELQEYLPVIQKKKVKTLSKGEVRNLTFAADELMHECLIRLFFDTGCRVSELATAKWADIEHDFTRFILNVNGKGRGGMTKQRTVRISAKTMAKLDEMKANRDYENDYIFTSDRTKKPYTTRRLSQILKEVSANSNVGDISSHIFRKSVATSLLENGLPVEYVSEYLGHSDINTTRKNYVDMTRSLHDKVDAAFGEEI